jgi:hypothetical protein
MVMLLVIEPHGRDQQRLGVADNMKAKAQEAANAILDRFATRANGAAGITPERVIRDGDKAQEILNLIDKDVDIAILVLGAGIDIEGPDPLASNIGKTAGAFPIPVAIVRSSVLAVSVRGTSSRRPTEISQRVWALSRKELRIIFGAVARPRVPRGGPGRATYRAAWMVRVATRSEPYRITPRSLTEYWVYTGGGRKSPSPFQNRSAELRAPTPFAWPACYSGDAH